MQRQLNIFWVLKIWRFAWYNNSNTWFCIFCFQVLGYWAHIWFKSCCTSMQHLLMSWWSSVIETDYFTSAWHLGEKLTLQSIHGRHRLHYNQYMAETDYIITKTWHWQRQTTLQPIHSWWMPVPDFLMQFVKVVYTLVAMSDFCIIDRSYIYTNAISIT